MWINSLCIPLCWKLVWIVILDIIRNITANIYIKCSSNKVQNAHYRNKNKKGNNTPQHFLLAFLSSFFISRMQNKLGQTPEEKYQGKTKKNWNQTINNTAYISNQTFHSIKCRK